jgi:hypothetical protein
MEHEGLLPAVLGAQARAAPGEPGLEERLIVQVHQDA